MADYDIKPAWRLNDLKFEQEAIAFWLRLKLLPAGVEVTSRAKELAAVAYDGDELVGVATTVISPMPALRQKFATFRCAVAPDHRGAGIAVQLTRFCKNLLEKWAEDHPEEGVMGMTAVLEGYKAGRTLEPFWPVSGLTLIGYTPQGHQLRIVWFKHARVD